VPKKSLERPQSPKVPFVPRKNSKWTAYKKAEACIEFIRDKGLADTNEWYTHNVMLPLIGAIHDDNIANKLTIEEATELFMEAISGGERYGVMGRGPNYFMRQWRSHRPEIPRMGTKSLGGLIWAAQQEGFECPWKSEVREDLQAHYDKEGKELEEQIQIITQALKEEFD
jgi:hypothetical protein